MSRLTIHDFLLFMENTHNHSSRTSSLFLWLLNLKSEILIPQLSLRWHTHLHGLEAPIHVVRCDFKPCKPAVGVDQCYTVSDILLPYHQSTPLSCQPTNIHEFPHFSARIEQHPRPSGRLRNSEHLSHLYFGYLSPAKSRQRIDAYRRSSKQIPEEPQK